MLDVDGDGAVDVLLSNGDTTEFRSNPRQYHGIRIYDLVGNGLAEKQFIPAHGVMDFVMPDTGAEGDLDIASVSHFADFRHWSHQAAIRRRRRPGPIARIAQLPDIHAGLLRRTPRTCARLRCRGQAWPAGRGLATTCACWKTWPSAPAEPPQRGLF